MGRERFSVTTHKTDAEMSTLSLPDRYINTKIVQYTTWPQFKKRCGLASLTCAINYLFAEDHRLYTPREVWSVLEEIFPNDRSAIDNPGNRDLLRFFDYFLVWGGCRGSASREFDANHVQAWQNNASVLARIKSIIRDPKQVLVYHLEKHYNLVCGWYEGAKDPEDVYAQDANSKVVWLILADHSPHRRQPVWSKRWGDIRKDFLRNPKHCFLLFRREDAPS
jgi:hypothetical protein